MPLSTEPPPAPQLRKPPYMSDFIRLKRITFKEKIGVVAKLISKPRVETFSVKSEPVDIKS